MIASENVKQFLRDKCKTEFVGIAPATSISEEEKKQITTTLKILGEANPAMSGNVSVFDSEDFVDNAKAVIVFGRNSYFGTAPQNGGHIPRGAIGNFYLNEKTDRQGISCGRECLLVDKFDFYRSVRPFNSLARFGYFIHSMLCFLCL